MKKKYAILPGYVFSRSDGDRHFITAKQLIQLYGVNPAECIEVGEGVDWTGFIPLSPRDDGDYSLPDPKCNDLTAAADGG